VKRRFRSAAVFALAEFLAACGSGSDSDVTLAACLYATAVELAGPDAVDCGSAPHTDFDLVQSWTCVRDAMQEGRAFYGATSWQGIDASGTGYFSGDASGAVFVGDYVEDYGTERTAGITECRQPGLAPVERGVGFQCVGGHGPRLDDCS
jgi:hypothetical protein